MFNRNLYGNLEELFFMIKKIKFQLAVLFDLLYSFVLN